MDYSLRPNLRSASNWTFENQWRLTAQPTSDLAYRGWYPIPFWETAPMSARLLAVLTQSEDARFTWYVGAWVTPIYQSTAQSSIGEVRLPRQVAPINRGPCLITVPEWGEYRLRFEVPWYYQTITVRLYKYVGTA